MMQTRALSAVEVTLNIGSGVLVAWVMTITVMPVWGFAPDAGQALQITAAYTAVSWVRSYFWRRVFVRIAPAISALMARRFWSGLLSSRGG